MSPDDVATVRRSWAALASQRPELVAALARRLATAGARSPRARAEWLVDSVGELVPLLTCPSRLADHARRVATSWPDSVSGPTYASEGRAWMAAAAECVGGWSASSEEAWSHGWQLLCEILVAETLSPFSDGAAG